METEVPNSNDIVIETLRKVCGNTRPTAAHFNATALKLNEAIIMRGEKTLEPGTNLFWHGHDVERAFVTYISARHPDDAREWGSVFGDKV